VDLVIFEKTKKLEFRKEVSEAVISYRLSQGCGSRSWQDATY